MTELAANGKPIESVWDYPRPPRLEAVEHHVSVVHGGVTIASTTGAYRVLETSQPPAYYLPAADVAVEHLRPSRGVTYCEWKGTAAYADVVVPADGGETTVADAAWTYPSPTAPFAPITGYWAFYPQKLDGCFVDGERVDPNAGSFYGGWITSNVTGPFKGAPGTSHW